MLRLPPENCNQTAEEEIGAAIDHAYKAWLWPAPNSGRIEATFGAGVGIGIGIGIDRELTSIPEFVGES